MLAEAGAPVEELRAEVDRRRLRYLDGLDEDDAEALRALGIDSTRWFGASTATSEVPHGSMTP